MRRTLAMPLKLEEQSWNKPEKLLGIRLEAQLNQPGAQQDLHWLESQPARNHCSAPTQDPAPPSLAASSTSSVHVKMDSVKIFCQHLTCKTWLLQATDGPCYMRQPTVSRVVELFCNSLNGSDNVQTYTRVI